jgi:hypothetical protein
VAAGVTVGSTVAINSDAASGTASECFFNHRFGVAWSTFRGSLSSCGFSQTNNGTFIKYSGRVHMYWEDYDSMSAPATVHTPASIWHEVTISLASESTSTTSPASNVEEPSAAAFSVTAFDYRNQMDTVAIDVSYSIATNWPYFPYLTTARGSQLVGSSDVYGTLDLPLGTWPSSSWDNIYVDSKNGSGSCSAVGDVCTLEGTFSYTWTPSAVSSSCSVAADYQFDFLLGCHPAALGSNLCDQKMRLALNDPTLGIFTVPETIVDLCQAETIPTTSEPSVGGPIGFTSTIGFKTPVREIRFREYHVRRQDLVSTDPLIPAFWELWNLASNTPSSLGSTVALAVSSLADAGTSGLSWTLTSTFTPNTLVHPANISSLEYGNEHRSGNMIVLPDDRGATFIFEVEIVVRIFTGTPGRRVRRMVYVDRTVDSSGLGKRQEEGTDLTLDLGELEMEVPSAIPCESFLASIYAFINSCSTCWTDNASFYIDSVGYTKASNGLVTASIAYHLELNWPYYGYYANTTDGAQLIHTNGVYGGVHLSAFPESSFASSGQDGQKTPEGENCTSYGQKCAMLGTLEYSWMPEPGFCTISSTEAQQFSFMLGCLAEGYNDPAECAQPMRVVLGNPETFGAWKLSGNIDFCKSAESEFGLTWEPAFDVASTTRLLGQPISASGSFSLLKKLAAVKVEAFRVSRADLTGDPWELWNADTTNTYAIDSGSRTAIGTGTNFHRTITTSDSGFTWTVSTYFTPNIRTMSGTVSKEYADRMGEMIVLPSDNELTLSFRASLVVRLFGDSTQTPGGLRRRRRRLEYREVEVASLEPAEGVEVQTRSVVVSVGNGIPVASVTGQQSTGLSGGAVGAIVGVVGAAIAVAGVAGVLVWRRKTISKQVQVDKMECSCRLESCDGKLYSERDTESRH